MQFLGYHKKCWILYEQQEGHCFYCDLPHQYHQMSRDHFYPRSKGGKSKGNTVLSCRKCNSDKSSQTIYQYREYACRKVAEYLRLPRVMNQTRLENSQIQLITRWINIINRCTYILRNDIAEELSGNPYTSLHPNFVNAQTLK